MNILNISETGTGRQARNVLSSALVDTVTPWFADVADDQNVQQALANLSKEGRRAQALNYLGLTVEEASTPHALAA